MVSSGSWKRVRFHYGKKCAVDDCGNSDNSEEGLSHRH